MIPLNYEQRIQLLQSVEEYLKNPINQTVKAILIDFILDLKTSHSQGWVSKIAVGQKNIFYEILIQCFGKTVKRDMNQQKKGVKAYIARNYNHYAFGYHKEKMKRFNHMMMDSIILFGLIYNIKARFYGVSTVQNENGFEIVS